MPHFVIYRKSDSMIMINNRTNKKYYASMGRATAALTRQIDNGQITENTEPGLGGLIPSLYACADLEHYNKKTSNSSTWL